MQQDARVGGPSPVGSVAVVVPCRNELATLPALLASIEGQTRRPERVVVADGVSTDGTREWLEAAARDRPWLQVVDNPARQISAALNRAVAAAHSEVVARMDAHATYAPDFLEAVVRVFDERPEVVAVGGAMTSVGQGSWGRSIATVLSRPVGMGGARHRVGGEGGPVDHAFSPAYRRDALLAAGGFDEAFLANEDFELDVRLRAEGGTVWLEPTARCTWRVREHPVALSRQMFRYGSFKARTLLVHPDSLRLRQLVPPALIVGLAALTIGSRRLGGSAGLVYLLAAGSAGASAARADGTSRWRAAAAVPVIHLSWGAGLLAGLVAHRSARTSA